MISSVAPHLSSGSAYNWIYIVIGLGGAWLGGKSRYDKHVLQGGKVDDLVNMSADIKKLVESAQQIKSEVTPNGGHTDSNGDRTRRIEEILTEHVAEFKEFKDEVDARLISLEAK